MKARDIEEMLEQEGFNLEKDGTDVFGYGYKIYVRNDGEESGQVMVSVEKAEN